MMQIRFSNPRLIKISMIYLYIKPEVKKKNDTAAMTTAINEASIGEGDFSGAGNENFFSYWTGLLPHRRVSPKR